MLIKGLETKILKEKLCGPKVTQKENGGNGGGTA